ncbi:MAG: hypothetical protein AB7E08_06245 [Candidatus Omnitrophota bacterium]
MEHEELVAYSQVTREKIERLSEEFYTYQKRMNSNLEKIYDKLDKFAEKMEQKFDKMESRLEDVLAENRKLSGRPPWTLSVFITGVVSLATALAVAILK